MAPSRRIIDGISGLNDFMIASQEAEKILDTFGPAPQESLSEEAYMRSEFESYIDRQKSKGELLTSLPAPALMLALFQHLLAFGCFRDRAKPLFLSQSHLVSVC